MSQQEMVEFTKHDPALSRMSIFRPVSKGARSNKMLDISFDYNNINLRVQSMETLDARDQTLLFVLIAMATQHKQGVINKSSTGNVGKNLWEQISSFSDTDGYSIAFCTTFYKIIKNCGMQTSGKSYKFIEESLLRLAKTNITIKKGKQTEVTRLIASLKYNENEEVAVAINPRIAEAITGQYVIINLEQRNLLTNDTSKILFSYLSSVINEGNSVPYKATYKTLVEKTWGEEFSNDSTSRGRKKQVKESLNQINTLEGWDIDFEENLVKVNRKKGTVVIPKVVV